MYNERNFKVNKFIALAERHPLVTKVATALSILLLLSMMYRSYCGLSHEAFILETIFVFCGGFASVKLVHYLEQREIRQEIDEYHGDIDG